MKQIYLYATSQHGVDSVVRVLSSAADGECNAALAAALKTSFMLYCSQAEHSKYESV
jgi:hypothetical protein